MTGRDLKTLREGLELDPFQLAVVLGVHVSSVYRWESSRGSLTFERAVSRLVEPMRDLLVGPHGIRPDLASRLGRDIRAKMISHHDLGGLSVVVGFLLEKQKP